MAITPRWRSSNSLIGTRPRHRRRPPRRWLSRVRHVTRRRPPKQSLPKRKPALKPRRSRVPLGRRKPKLLSNYTYFLSKEKPRVKLGAFLFLWNPLLPLNG